MPRPLVYGNGHFLIQTDRHYAIRDLFFPQVGQPNHLAGHAIRMGVWVDHRFAWIDADGWTREMGYEPSTMVGSVRLRNSGLRIEIAIEEAMDPVHPVFVRHMTVLNLDDREHEVRVFFTHDLRINETDIGDTALYHPQSESMIHYKGKAAFLFGGRGQGHGLYEYTTGIKAFRDQIGSWVDAEDGHLGKNPISQGSVDSTISYRLDLATGGRAELTTWIICGHSLEDVVRRQSEWIGDDLNLRIRYARAYWKSWLNGDRHRQEPAVPERFQELYDRSLLLIRSQIDQQGGILAANDSDIMETNRATYSFVWPRDGALVSMVMDDAGHPEVCRRYFEYCLRILPEDRPVYLHKYAPDGTLGASWHPFLSPDGPEVPFQEDETALTVLAVGKHHESVEDIERIARWYPRLIRDACDFMLAWRDSATGLPKPSWDLWEERRGVHAYTVASVIAGLRAGARIAGDLGDDHAKSRWNEGALELQEACKRHLWDSDRGVFFRMISHEGTPDRTLDSAVLSLGLLGAFSADDPMVQSTLAVIEQGLSCPGGGFARYERDYYFRRTEDSPGNPWVICTMWVAQLKMLTAANEAQLRDALSALDWVLDRAESTGVLAEQYHPHTREPLSVSPLTWSHAEVARTVQTFVKRLAELK